jgi:hypothetical protein
MLSRFHANVKTLRILGVVSRVYTVGCVVEWFDAVRGSDGPVTARRRAGLFGNLGEIPDEGGRGPGMCHPGLTDDNLYWYTVLFTTSLKTP